MTQRELTVNILFTVLPGPTVIRTVCKYRAGYSFLSRISYLPRAVFL